MTEHVAVRVCKSKSTFRSKKRAVATAHHIRDTDPLRPLFYAYQCAVCRLWHLTKRAPDRRAS